MLWHGGVNVKRVDCLPALEVLPDESSWQLEEGQTRMLQIMTAACCLQMPIVQTAELNCPCFPTGGLVLHVELAKRAPDEEHWERPTLCGLTF